MLRSLTARLIAPKMARTGFRFSKDYRWGATFGHRVVYALVSTIEANCRADQIAAASSDWHKAWSNHR